MIKNGEDTEISEYAFVDKEATWSRYLIEGIQLGGAIFNPNEGEANPGGTFIAGVCHTIEEAQYYVKAHSKGSMLYWWREVNKIRYTKKWMNDNKLNNKQTKEVKNGRASKRNRK